MALHPALNMTLNPAFSHQCPVCSTGLVSKLHPGSRVGSVTLRSNSSGKRRDVQVASQLSGEPISTVDQNRSRGGKEKAAAEADDWETEVLNPGPENKEAARVGRRGGRRSMGEGASTRNAEEDKAAFGWAVRARSRAVRAAEKGIREVPILEFVDGKKTKARKKKALKKKKALAKERLTPGSLLAEGNEMGGSSLGQTSFVVKEGAMQNPDLFFSANEDAGIRPEDMGLSEEYETMIRNKVLQMSQAAGFRNRFKDLGDLRAALDDESPPSDSQSYRDVPRGSQVRSRNSLPAGASLLTADEDEEEDEIVVPWRTAVMWDAEGQSEVEEWSPAIGPASGLGTLRQKGGLSGFRVSDPSLPEFGQMAQAQGSQLSHAEGSSDSEESDEWEEEGWSDLDDQGRWDEGAGSDEDEVMVRSFVGRDGDGRKIQEGRSMGTSEGARVRVRVSDEDDGAAPLGEARAAGSTSGRGQSTPGGLPLGELEPAVKSKSGPPRRRRLGGRWQVGGNRERDELGGSTQSRGYILNRKLVDASGLDEVLEVVACEMELEGIVGRGISAVNAATALHRIATRVEAAGLSASARLAVARRQEVVKLVKASMDLLPQSEAQALANMAWALAKIGGTVLYTQEADLLAEALLGRTESLTAQHLANSASAFATAQHAAPELLDAMSARGAALIGSFSSQELSQVVWAHAVLAQSPTPLLDAVDRLLTWPDKTNYFASWSEQQLANTAWAYAVLAEVHRPAFALLWREITARDSFAEQDGDAEQQSLTERDESGHEQTALEPSPDVDESLAGSEDDQQQIRDRHLAQVYQVGLTLELENRVLNSDPVLGSGSGSGSGSEPGSGSGLGLGLGLGLTGSLRERSQIAWGREVGRAKTRRASGLEREVGFHLASTSLPWVPEFIAAEYSLDFALPGGKVAVEVDGPSHFTRNTDEPLGSTLLKRRHLAASQWTLISVPYYEWEELYGQVEQEEYIRTVLTRWGVIKEATTMDPTLAFEV